MCFMARAIPTFFCHEICRVVAAIDFADWQHPSGFLLLYPQVINLYMTYSRDPSLLDHALAGGRVHVHASRKLHAEITGQGNQAQSFGGSLDDAVQLALAR